MPCRGIRALVAQGSAAEALPLYEEALAARVALLGPMHAQVAATRVGLAQARSSVVRGAWVRDSKRATDVVVSARRATTRVLLSI